MKNLIFVFCLMSTLLQLASCKKKAISGEVIITNTNIINLVKGGIIQNQTIVIDNGSITSVIPFSESDEIISETIISGRGKYVIPALWDMHTHYTTSSRYNGFLNLFIANGVLGVRDLWGDLETRDSLTSTNTMAPDIYLSGAIIDGPFTLLQGSLQPKTTEEAIRMVDSLHQKGADFIKVYDDLSEDIYNAISNRCNELELPFVGHVPMSVRAETASNKGQKSMEHLNGIWKSSTTLENEIDSLESVFKSYFMANDLPAALNTFVTINGKFNAEFDKQKTAQLAQILRKNETFITPTLTTIDRHWSRIDGTYKTQLENKYIPAELLQQWDPELNFPEKMFPPIAWEEGKELLITSLEIINILYQNDVSILAGTDCGVSYVIPGYSIHEELKLMVEAGLSNVDALKTATINPAKYFGISDKNGAVAPEMNANLVLLNANPLEDISNTGEIYGVVRKGRYLNREYLDNLLKEAEIEE